MQSQGSPREMGLAANRGEDCLELPLLEWVELRQSRTLVQSLDILALYASMLIIISCYLFVNWTFYLHFKCYLLFWFSLNPPYHPHPAYRRVFTHPTTPASLPSHSPTSKIS